MLFVTPSNISGECHAPDSKSAVQRMFALSLLTPGTSIIITSDLCDDSLSALEIIKKLGAEVSKINSGGYSISPPRNLLSGEFTCGESGLCMRMFAPIIALSNATSTLIASGTLASRPTSWMLPELQELGVQCEDTGGFPPLQLCGPLKSGNIRLDGSISSQFLTGLLFALPTVSGESLIEVYKLKSRPYIDMTLSILRDASVEIEEIAPNTFRLPGSQTPSARTWKPEGDWSGAAFLLVAAALQGCVTISNLDTSGYQGDKVILQVLKEVGVPISVDGKSISINRNYQVTSSEKSQSLKPFSFNATAYPDLFPPLVALAAGINGESQITGVHRLIHKESNRAESLQTEFSKIGVPISVSGDIMTIKGGKIEGGEAFSHHDHRIAMALAVAGLASQRGVRIHSPACVKKSYPNFFSDFAKLGARILEV